MCLIDCNVYNNFRLLGENKIEWLVKMWGKKYKNAKKIRHLLKCKGN